MGIPEKIEEFAKKHLTEQGVRFEAKERNEIGTFRIQEIRGLFYITAGTRIEGDSTAYKEHFGFVCDIDENIIVDIAPIDGSYAMSSSNVIRFIDDTNILVPTKGISHHGIAWHHYKIENGKAEQVFFFDGGVNQDLQPYSANLLVYEIGANSRQLYDFTLGKLIGPEFTMIFSPQGAAITSFYTSNIACGGLKEIAEYWQIPKGDKSEGNINQFMKLMTERMQKDNTFCAYVRIWNYSKKGDREFDGAYHALMFIDNQGNFEGELFYMDGDDFLRLLITLETYPAMVQMLKEKLKKALDAKIIAAERKEALESNLLPQVMRMLLPDTAQ